MNEHRPRPVRVGVRPANSDGPAIADFARATLWRLLALDKMYRGLAAFDSGLSVDRGALLAPARMVSRALPQSGVGPWSRGPGAPADGSLRRDAAAQRPRAVPSLGPVASRRRELPLSDDPPRHSPIKRACDRACIPVLN